MENIWEVPSKMGNTHVTHQFHSSIDLAQWFSTAPFYLTENIWHCLETLMVVDIYGVSSALLMWRPRTLLTLQFTGPTSTVKSSPGASPRYGDEGGWILRGWPRRSSPRWGGWKNILGMCAGACVAKSCQEREMEDKRLPCDDSPWAVVSSLCLSLMSTHTVKLKIFKILNPEYQYCQGWGAVLLRNSYMGTTRLLTSIC